VETRRINKRELILEQALELFSEKGYRETSLQDIADHLGVTRQAFYYYFDSKEDILWSLIERLGKQLLERALPLITEDGDPEQELFAIMLEHTQTLIKNAAAFKVYFAEREMVDDARNQKLKEGEDEYVHLIAGIIRKGQMHRKFRSGDPVVLALLALGTSNSILRWYKQRGKVKEQDVSQLVAEMVVKGLLI
jgi:TetR/AcrR family transcriptional regulator, cholesterol catabolism regulator